MCETDWASCDGYPGMSALGLEQAQVSKQRAALEIRFVEATFHVGSGVCPLCAARSPSQRFQAAYIVQSIVSQSEFPCNMATGDPLGIAGRDSARTCQGFARARPLRTHGSQGLCVEVPGRFEKWLVRA